MPCLPEVLADIEETIEDETCLIDELEVTVADPGTKVSNNHHIPRADYIPRFTPIVYISRLTYSLHFYVV